MSELGTVLYIGGFELPDKNAAAQRVIGIAKILRDIGYNVKFINALKECGVPAKNKKYFGFSTFEYKREKNFDYLVSGKTAISLIKKDKPDMLIAYNYPALSLNRIRKYCQNHNITCIADVTEWYKVYDGDLIYRLIKNIDSSFRMRYVHKHMDAIIAISRFLYNYYKSFVPVALVPPTVDIDDEKWKSEDLKDSIITSLVYAGSPNTLKERLDLIVESVESLSNKNIVLNIVGITEEQFRKMYSWTKPISESVVFWGRISHKNALKVVKNSTWSILIRENNSVVKAGFPTKLVESISCGTPVIVNDFSNVRDYLSKENSIMIKDVSEIGDALYQAISNDMLDFDRKIFNYQRYKKELANVIDDL